jgi:hypothetical protein
MATAPPVTGRPLPLRAFVPMTLSNSGACLVARS